MQVGEAAAIQSYLQARASLTAAIGAERLAELDTEHSAAPPPVTLRAPPQGQTVRTDCTTEFSYSADTRQEERWPEYSSEYFAGNARHNRYKPARSLRDQVFLMHKSKPDDAMLQADGIKHSSWKGHDDPFSILSTEERLRQKLARKMRAASYKLGGQDWFDLFSRYDTDHSGNLDFNEFCRAVRRDAAVGPETVTDDELRAVFDFIDIDKDHMIDANELQKFMATELRKDKDGSAKEQGANTARVQKFLAESIALERVVMRAKADMSSARVGVLPKGEIVAVTHVAGNRMHVRRLRWTADLEQREENQDSGWVSERAVSTRHAWSGFFTTAAAHAGPVPLLHLPVCFWHM